MLGFGRVKQYNSGIFDLSEPHDFTRFYNLVDTINDFDFAVGNVIIAYTEDYSRATIHVETKDRIIETWLIKHGFERA